MKREDCVSWVGELQKRYRKHERAKRLFLAALDRVDGETPLPTVIVRGDQLRDGREDEKSRPGAGILGTSG
jgi:hypothetical protein